MSEKNAVHGSELAQEVYRGLLDRGQLPGREPNLNILTTPVLTSDGGLHPDANEGAFRKIDFNLNHGGLPCH
jgi:hypothetical protein